MLCKIQAKSSSFNVSIVMGGDNIAPFNRPCNECRQNGRSMLEPDLVEICKSSGSRSGVEGLLNMVIAFSVVDGSLAFLIGQVFSRSDSFEALLYLLLCISLLEELRTNARAEGSMFRGTSTCTSSSWSTTFA